MGTAKLGCRLNTIFDTNVDRSSSLGPLTNTKHNILIDIKKSHNHTCPFVSGMLICLFPVPKCN